MDKNKIISKSKYVAGLQCLKYLWYLINDPDAIPPFDEVTQFRFQQGHDVGNLAKSLFPGGIDIEYRVDIEAELARARELTNLGTPVTTDPAAATASAAVAAPAAAAANNSVRPGGTGISSCSTSTDNTGTGGIGNYIKNTGSTSTATRLPLFEPAFTYKNAFARADILEPSGTDAWNIIEVKSASSIKDINKDDISFQKYCYEGAGLKIDKCYLMYLNKDFIKDGPIDPHRFFTKDDVTIEAETKQENVEEKIKMMLDAISSTSCPEISIGKNCYSPYDCPLKQICWSHLPKNNVFELYRGKDLASSFFYPNGIIEISEINETSMLSSIQHIQYRAVTENCEIIDRDSIDKFLKKLQYPLYFLDFETFATAIPLFDGLKPYQNIPFQFSFHIMESPDAKPESLYFLAGDDKADPRIGFLENLKKALDYDGNYDNKHPGSPATGSILVYYESFEKNILKELAKLFPDHSWWIEDATERIVDMYEPFGNFYYYNSQQKGSASLKKVLPALTDINYDDMEISNGQMASVRYLNITFLKGETEPDKAQVEKIRKDLLDYCGLDTEGMIFILRELYKIAE